MSPPAKVFSHAVFLVLGILDVLQLIFIKFELCLFRFFLYPVAFNVLFPIIVK